MKTKTKENPELRAKIITNRVGGAIGKVVRFLLLLGIGFSLIYPLLFMFITAFRSHADMLDPSVVWLTKIWSFENFELLFKTLDYPALFSYTAQISLVSAAVQTFVCSFVGYGFARYRFPLRGAMFALVVLTIIVPLQTYLSPMYMSFRFFEIPIVSSIMNAVNPGSGTFNLLDTPWPFWIQTLFGMGYRSGLFIFIYRQFYRGMPGELEEAALIDGCGAIRTYFRVMLPNAKSSMITVFIFSVVWHWNDYLQQSFLSETRQTIATSLASLRTVLQRLEGQVDLMAVQAQVQAGALLAIAPLLILFIFGQRYLSEGIERSGIVG